MWIFWSILLLVIGVGLIVYSWWDSNDWKVLAGVMGILVLKIALTILNINILGPKPTALDVYRGNTELEIIAINGVPTDTIVVFKNK